MGGEVLFQDALAARLELIKPSRADVESCLKKHPLALTKGVQKVVELLHARGTPVYLVSGGFRQVRPLPKILIQMTSELQHSETFTPISQCCYRITDD